jgi:1-deoxy-D-xylulose-5-phosphate reductoisomerase
VLNAANELAVDAFLQGKVAFLDIPRIIGAVVDEHVTSPASDLEQVLAADGWARHAAQAVICKIQGVSYA